MNEDEARLTVASQKDWQTLLKAALIFAIAFAIYFASRFPGLDEWDSVQFAMSIREFNVWKHQPHPPGYRLCIFFAWLPVRFFGWSPSSDWRVVPVGNLRLQRHFRALLWFTENTTTSGCFGLKG